jgi:hypothetical protein
LRGESFFPGWEPLFVTHFAQKESKEMHSWEMCEERGASKGSHSKLRINFIAMGISMTALGAQYMAQNMTHQIGIQKS